MSEEIISRILNNSATEAEKGDFYKSLEENSDQRNDFYSYKNLYAVNQCKGNVNNTSKQESFERFWERVNPSKKARIVDLWMRYAAVFILALSVGYLLRYFGSGLKNHQAFSNMVEYTSEKGSVSTIHLQDGSQIWLSSGSKITVSKNGDGEMLAQLNGEAYFDMIPDPARKFTVDLGDFKVKDIGTKFNIRAYRAEKAIYTTLIDGVIDFYRHDEKTIHSVKPGEHIEFDKQSSQFNVSQQDPTIAIAWKDGKFVFINKTLTEICSELENWYNVEIIIQNKSLANTRYTSVIKRTTTVNMVMKMLSLTDKINYKINDRKEARDIVYIY